MSKFFVAYFAFVIGMVIGAALQEGWIMKGAADRGFAHIEHSRWQWNSDVNADRE